MVNGHLESLMCNYLGYHRLADDYVSPKDSSAYVMGLIISECLRATFFLFLLPLGFHLGGYINDRSYLFSLGKFST